VETEPNLKIFLNPESVAVVGATERPGAWGSFIMGGLRSLNYPGKIYPVNRQADQVFGLKSYKDLRDVEGPVDLAVLAIPEEFVSEDIDRSSTCRMRR
jgi:acyl-CoA synthetase (NDP forming)